MGRRDCSIHDTISIATALIDEDTFLASAAQISRVITTITISRSCDNWTANIGAAINSASEEVVIVAMTSQVERRIDLVRIQRGATVRKARKNKET